MFIFGTIKPGSFQKDQYTIFVRVTPLLYPSINLDTSPPLKHVFAVFMHFQPPSHLCSGRAILSSFQPPFPRVHSDSPIFFFSLGYYPRPLNGCYEPQDPVYLRWCPVDERMQNILLP